MLASKEALFKKPLVLKFALCYGVNGLTEEWPCPAPATPAAIPTAPPAITPIKIYSLVLSLCCTGGTGASGGGCVVEACCVVLGAVSGVAGIFVGAAPDTLAISNSPDGKILIDSPDCKTRPVAPSSGIIPTLPSRHVIVKDPSACRTTCEVDCCDSITGAIT